MARSTAVIEKWTGGAQTENQCCDVPIGRGPEADAAGPKAAVVLTTVPKAPLARVELTGLPILLGGTTAIMDTTEAATVAEAGRSDITIGPLWQALSDEIAAATAPRLHMAWNGTEVRVWLGVDGPTPADSQALVGTVERVLRRHGLKLVNLVCNGRTLFDCGAVDLNAPPRHPQEN